MNLTNLKIAFRGILKSKTESAISIFGLGIGLGSIMLLVVLVIHEFSFDKFIPNHQSAYRLIQGNECRTPFPLAEEIKNDIPEVVKYFRFYQTNEVQIKDKNDQILEVDLFAFSDETLFDCLDIRFRYGVPAVSNSEVAISETIAKRYFKSDNVTGNILTVKLDDKFLNLTISGVYNDFPSNSSLHPAFLANIELSGEVFGQTKKVFGEYGTNQNEFESWDKNYFYTYLFLNLSANADDVVEKIQVYTALLDESKWGEASYSLQPVSEIYFKSTDLSGNIYNRVGNANESKYYLAIAFVILCIAVINYIFLTKAKILNRLIELGVKKAMGATNRIIREQVLFEANLISLLSLVPAFLIIIPGISFVNSALGKTVGSDVFSLIQTWLSLIVIILLTGFLSGFLIGNSISRTSVVLLLSGQLRKIKNRSWNNSFLSFHFAIFIVLIVSVLTFKKQISYSLNNFKSISPENILVCDLNTSELQKQFGVISNELGRIPGVIKVAGSSFIPPFNSFLPINLKTAEEMVRFDGLIMGEGMIELLDMEVIDGEPFGEFQQGQTNLVINESAALEYGIKAGELLNGFTVRGIVKDFNAHSMHTLIQPMVILQQHPEKMRLIAVKTNGINDASIISDIHNIIKQISPEAFISINYLTDDINQFYQREQNQARLISMFSLLAIVLSIMGLFGIVLITITKRTKEIGVRKVNGARIVEVMAMLNKDFLIWVIIAFVISVPISYYAMLQWLENFAYTTGLSWWIFIVAGILAFIIALVTVSWQSWKIATKNPIDALRYE